VQRLRTSAEWDGAASSALGGFIKQRNAIEIAKRMIWWFYRALKDYKLAPSAEQAELLRARFDRIFKRASTGFAVGIHLIGVCFTLGAA
jgi:hypothetical protein